MRLLYLLLVLAFHAQAFHAMALPAQVAPAAAPAQALPAQAAPAQTLSVQALPAQALQQISVRDQERASVSISSTDVNRIALVNDRIKAIYGGQDQANFTTDEETGQVFITTKKPNLFGISLITEKGFTIDLNLKPSDVTSETILLSVNPDEREIETLTSAALQPNLFTKALKGCKYITTYFGL